MNILHSGKKVMKAVNGDDVVFTDKKERLLRLKQKQTRKESMLLK